uniref:TPR_REGION domain-containing protein n=1 Tax=Steinernema glaseri TaxID=37863 RepID=A0A1I8A962_9BILA
MAPRQIKAVKKVLHAGQGALPEYRDGTKAFFNYEVLLPLNDVKKEGFSENKDDYKEDYKSIDDTRKPYPHGYGKPLELVFGKKFQLPIFETCLSSMHVGEICQFDIDEKHLYTYPMVSKKLRDISRAEVDPSHKHHEGHHCAAMGPVKLGYEELDELSEHPKPLRIIFHMLNVMQPETYEAESWQLNVEEKLASLDTLRLQGNDLFKAGKFEEATIKYREALGRVDVLLLREKPGDPEWHELDKKNISLYLNLSQCYLNLGEFYDAVRTASEVLKRDASNEKALFRRAKAYIGTWELNEAEDDLNKLESLYPNSKRLVDMERSILSQKRKEDEVKSKSVFKEMMKGLSIQ